MDSTMALWQKALAMKHQSAWARTLNVSPSTFSQATKTGRLSPLLAGNIALEVGEDPEHWISVAALEQAATGKDQDLLARFRARAKAWRKRLLSSNKYFTRGWMTRAFQLCTRSV